MSATRRLGRARALLSGAVGVAAALWGGATLALVVAAFAAAELALGLPDAVRALALPAALVAGTIAWAAAVWRGRRVRSIEAVALWIEERHPELRYALVTAADPYCAAAPGAGELERLVAESRWSPALAAAVTRGVARPSLLLGVALLALRVLPGDSVGLGIRPAARQAAEGRGRPGVAADLGPVTVRINPPAYSGRRPVTLSDPATIAGLVGSGVDVEGRGPAERVEARLAGELLAVQGDARTWRVAFRMPPQPAALVLAAREVERLIVVEPEPDSVPVVTLTLPARDSVLRTPRGSLTLAAEATDDIGLAAAWFEFIVSSGERESFTFRTGRLGLVELGGQRAGSRRIPLALDSLRLAPGDVLHLRAVATDVNTETGPGLGVSETRTLRVAAAGEYDSVAIEGLPQVAEDTAALSQRMLIMLAEALERRRRDLPRRTVIEESRAIGADQTRLRRRVADVIFMRLTGEAGAEEVEGEEAAAARTPEEVLRAAEEAAARDPSRPLDFSEDESPVVAVNRPLLEAYNAMWDASRELAIGEPDDALPHMRAALDAIQRARRAERLYLRGRPPTLVVDLARVRLAGDRGDAAPAPRAPHPAPFTREAMAARFAVLLRLPPDSAPALADSLQLMRLELLGRDPRAAAALGEAVRALRRGQDPAAALSRAREALAPREPGRSALPAWELAW